MHRSKLGNFDELGRLIEPRVDFLAQQSEIDRLRQQSNGSLSDFVPLVSSSP